MFREIKKQENLGNRINVNKKQIVIWDLRIGIWQWINGQLEEIYNSKMVENHMINF